MDPLSAAIGVGGPLLGGLVGGLFGQSGASAQRSWEERMMNTQYQRTAEDMRKAGLNPLMMYTRGGGPVGGIPTPPNIGEALGGPLSQGIAASAKAAAIDIPMAKSAMAKNAADANQSQAAADLARDQGAKTRMDTQLASGQLSIQIQQLENLQRTGDLTVKQQQQIDEEILEIRARKLLEDKNAMLAGANARSATVQASAMEVLAPLIKSAIDGINRLYDAPKGFSPGLSLDYPNEDIRPPSYIKRTQGSHSAKAAGMETSQALGPGSGSNTYQP